MPWCLLALLLLLAGCTTRAARDTSAPAEFFREVASEAGLKFEHFTGATGRYHMPEIMGAGGAFVDYDSDGDLDVYLVQGSVLQAGQTQPEASSGNRLFRNELVPSGRLSFVDVTKGSGTGLNAYGMGVAVGDYDNDGDPDLYITNFGSNVLLQNRGDGRFADVTKAAGVDDPRWSTSAAFFDYDRDGDLDLFVTNYVDFTVRRNKTCHGATGVVDYCTPRAYQPETDRLFRNDGNGKFTDVSVISGIGLVTGPGLGVATSDVNQDGWPDVFVANDAAANFLWINRHDGTFVESSLRSGAAYSEDGIAKAGMGVSSADFDADGDEDILVANLTGEGATLYRNDGGGNFSDASLRFGIGPATYALTGFGTEWFDFDNDGRLDIFIANGAVTVVEEQRGRLHPFEQRNTLLRNLGPDERFDDVGPRAGSAFAVSAVSRGAAFGDIDNDGDIDILVTNNNGPASLLRNEIGSRRSWFQARLVGAKSNRMGLGATVGVFRKGIPTLWRRAHSDSSYLSGSDPRVHFGLGDAPQIERVQVRWPDGTQESWTGLEPNRTVTLIQGEAPTVALD